MNVGADRQGRRSQLFLVRLWKAEAGDDHEEWHGRVQHILTGEVHPFHDWPSLVEFFIAMLPDPETGESMGDGS